VFEIQRKENEMKMPWTIKVLDAVLFVPDHVCASFQVAKRHLKTLAEEERAEVLARRATRMAWLARRAADRASAAASAVGRPVVV